MLKPNSYEFEYVEVEDLYKDAFKYKVGVKFIDKAFIDYNGYGWDVEFSYFDKVVEIIRREPYFHKINSIHVSKERSIANNEPIIFAGFLKAENDFHQIKKYYTLKQINDFYQNLNL